MLSKHIVGMATGAELVTGELVIDTELTEVDGFVASMGEDSIVTDATVSVTKEPDVAGARVKLRLKTWAADGIAAGTTPTLVRWIAFGR